MTRTWSMLRLLRPAGPGRPSGRSRGDYPGDHTTEAVCSLLPGLVDLLRSADPGARWSFRRLDDRHGPNVGLWFHSRPEVLREVASRTRREAGRQGWSVTADRYRLETAKYPSRAAAEQAADLATASSDFAVGLVCARAVTPRTQLATAVGHLREVVELVAGADRGSFLFSCWQSWTSGMRPDRRVELVRRADDQAGALLATAAEVSRPPRVAGHWRRYVDALHQAVGRDADGPDGAPRNYLLFDHAHLTHARLGIAVATEALAARVLRSAPDGAVGVLRPAAAVQLGRHPRALRSA